jgi:Bacteriodetes cell division protein (FtsL-like)
MAKNTFRTPPKPAKPTRPKRSGGPNPLVAKLVGQLRNSGLARLVGPDTSWVIRRIDRILWVSFLILIYIGSSHNSQRLIRNTQRARAERDDLKAQFTTLESAFMKGGKQSELSKQVLADSLLESQSPPYKIIVHATDDPQH